jgi:hypothetical protein
LYRYSGQNYGFRLPTDGIHFSTAFSFGSWGFQKTCSITILLVFAKPYCFLSPHYNSMWMGFYTHKLLKTRRPCWCRVRLRQTHETHV